VECILVNFPNWIEALAAVAIVVLTYLTLIVLKEYAADTKTIAGVSVSQTENAQKPFLALVFKTENVVQRFPGGWALENQGFGTALNIRHSEPRGNAGWVYATPLAKDNSHVLGTFDIDVMRNHGFAAEYESLSGTKYCTVVAWQDGLMRTTFHSVKAVE
jgi:hypothetical protein